MNPSNLKGIIDAEPAIQSMRNRIIETLRENFELNGFLPLETSILNHLDLLTHKYDPSSEIVREIYKLKDQGERDIGLRFDLTVPFAKFVAMNRNMKMPFRRYEIGRVFRNGPVKAGRLREFYQCDIDVVGQPGEHVEAEIIALVIKCFLELGIEPVIKIGNRKILTQLIESQGIAPANHDKVIGIIDKMEKVSRAELIKELTQITPNAEALLSSFTNTAKTEEVEKLFSLLDDFGVSQYCVFTPNLARGLNYYTGTIFEVFDKAGRITSSLGGGGRYDNMITDFIDNGHPYPAFGVAFGLEPIMAVLSKESTQPSLVDLLIIPMGETHKISFELAESLRKKGIRTLVLPTKVTKAMEYANAQNIPFTTVIGDRESRTKLIDIKRMSDGAKEAFSVTTAVKIAKFIFDK